MEKLVFDSGIREYQINENGVLRFNPGDPNLYARLLDAVDGIQAVEDSLVEKSGAVQPEDGAAALRLMADADRQVKEILGGVFGAGNDFEKIFGGVNVMAVGDNGERVITNLLNLLTPIIQDGAERCARQQADAAVAQARRSRAQRRKEP